MFLILLLAASALLTHSLSAAVFVGVTATTSLIALVFPKLFNESRKSILYMVLPVLIGAILVSPFLASAASPYLTESSLFNLATAVEQALLSQRAVPLETSLLLFACIVPFSCHLRKYKGRFFSFPVFLLIMWLSIPLLLTQDYSGGLYVDLVRFLYFLIYPVIIISAVTTADAAVFRKILGTRFDSKRQNKKTNHSFSKRRLKLSNKA